MPLNTPPVHLDGTLGAFLIGLIVAAVLCGVTNAQTLWFFQASNDPKYLKCIVGFLWILDMFHIVLISHVCYTGLVTDFTNLESVGRISWSLSIHIYIATLSDFIIKLLYSRRIWILSKQNCILTLGSLVLTIIATVSTFAFATKTFSYPSISDIQRISWLIYTGTASAAASDLWIAMSLCWYLSSYRTGFQSMETKINLLILYTINTGLLTSICAFATLICFATMSNYVFISVYFCLSKLYLNAFLATLNSRDKIRNSAPNGRDAGHQIMGSNSSFIPMHRFLGLIDNVQNLSVDTADEVQDPRKLPELGEIQYGRAV